MLLVSWKANNLRVIRGRGIILKHQASWGGICETRLSCPTVIRNGRPACSWLLHWCLNFVLLLVFNHQPLYGAIHTKALLSGYKFDPFGLHLRTGCSEDEATFCIIPVFLSVAPLHRVEAVIVLFSEIFQRDCYRGNRRSTIISDPIFSRHLPSLFSLELNPIWRPSLWSLTDIAWPSITRVTLVVFLFLRFVVLVFDWGVYPCFTLKIFSFSFSTYRRICWSGGDLSRISSLI